MPEAFDLYTKIRDLGFFGLAFFIGYASYKRKWKWTTECDDMIAAYEERLAEKDVLIAKAEKDRDEWKAMTFKVAGLVEDGVVIAKKKLLYDAS